MKSSVLSAIALAFTAACCVGNASASAITYQTRSIDQGFSNANYKTAFNSMTSPITTTSLSNFDHVGEGQLNSFQHVQLDFDVSTPVNLIIQFGLDGGYGAEIFADSMVKDYKTYDVWWNWNWGNTSQLMSTGSLSLGTGHHVIDGYWAEGCCAGWQSAHMSLDNGATWVDLSLANLDKLAVPEPGILALLGIGLAGMGVRRRVSQD